MGKEDESHRRPVMTSPLLFAEDIAVQYKMPRQRAHRWLKWLEVKYGAAVVGHFPSRAGERRYTTEAALESIGPAARSRYAEFEERMTRLGAEIRNLRHEVLNLKRRIIERNGAT